MRYAATSNTPADGSPAAPGDASDSAPGPRKAETARLLLEASTLEGEARRAVEDEVIRLNMPVAHEIAHRYRGRGIPEDDLDQVAFLGLTKAVRGFDPAAGHGFLSYAVPTIRGEVRRHFRDHGWTVRPPRRVQELQPRITLAQAELTQELGRSPRPSELAQHLDIDVEDVIEALGATGCFTATSLDAPAGEAGMHLLDRLGTDDDSYACAEARVALLPLLRDLTPRERRILELRFVRGLTQAEIGQQIGVTQMQVSRLLSGVLVKLRGQFEPDVA